MNKLNYSTKGTMCAMPNYPPTVRPDEAEPEELWANKSEEVLTPTPSGALRRTTSVHNLALEWNAQQQEMESLSDSNSDPDDVEQDELWEAVDAPDLAAYFRQWPMIDTKAKIKIARAYAALLAAQDVQARAPPAKKKVRFE